jgi:C4-dicarboxylate-specific signal transduction histidine kinase
LKHSFVTYRAILNLPSIRTVLLLALTFLASILIFGLGLHQAFQWQTFTETNDDLKLEGKVSFLYQEVHKILEIRMSALELMAQQIQNDVADKKFTASDYYPLLGLYVKKFDLSASGIIAPDGLVLESFNMNPEDRLKFIGKNFRDRGFIDLIGKLGTPVVMHAQKGKIKDHKIIVLAAPIWDKSLKNIVAYVAASINSSEIEILAKNAMGNMPELNFIILDQRNVMISSSGEKIKGDPFTPILTAIYSPSKETLITEGKNENGIESRAASRGLKFRNVTWTLGVSESLDYLNRQQRVVWKQTALGIGISVFLSFLVSLLISNLITKPISNLVEGMRLIENGRFHKDQESLKDGALFRETEEAWDALSSMEEGLRKNTETLEKEVQERTIQLIETHRILDEQRARAMEASRLAALGEMAGGIAHEINNPLGVILVSAESQLNKIKRNQVNLPALEISLRRIEDTATRIARIVQGLKTFSRAGGKEPYEKVLMDSIVNNTLSFCHEKFIHHKIELKVNPIPEDLSIECSSIQISQVILNLLNNAFDAVEDLPEKWISIDINDKDDHVEIRISDSGRGISEVIQDKIFQPFFTTKEIGRGTGLGLSISKGIIEAHNGSIFMDKSTIYTTFLIHLPKVRV